jgi:hypothetical protein
MRYVPCEPVEARKDKELGEAPAAIAGEKQDKPLANEAPLNSWCLDNCERSFTVPLDGAVYKSPVF